MSNPIQTRLVIERILPAIEPPSGNRLFASQASTTMVLSSSSKGCPVRTRGLCRPYSPPLLWPATVIALALQTYFGRLPILVLFGQTLGAAGAARAQDRG